MSDLMTVCPLEILLVEDNPGDVGLTRRALRDGKILAHLSTVPDGVEALAFLRRREGYAAAPRPDLILLDLSLPRKDGREVLSEIKQDADLHVIPVVVMSSSRAEEDVTKSYDLHANCYVTKPLDLEKFVAVVQSIEAFWLAVVKLPAKTGKE